MADRSDLEPEEYDPEAEFADPESDAITIPDVQPEEPEEKTVTPPKISTPEVTVAETDVPEPILQHFWILVLVLNAALLAVSLGSMLVLFEGMLTTGGTLAVGGFVLLGLALRRYRTLQSLEGSDPTPTADP
ncbi:DUF7322 domain-containing protein [Halostagnicola kamekurae]|uniref:DUF7322 domain-containing protein n=1 Tax=Halostagnicola kamekurae TaxID=619731 RepID=A0A1I6S403_9EURY|nr:hypothetical protein [Halostagnicola kamekurae]SFS71681.1 hypothetical protein SAMN04488556_2411 [Halostagnicola kamekurae]